MAQFLNHYHCEACDNEWSDEWSCQCNDRCANCRREVEPYQSDDITDEEEEGE